MVCFGRDATSETESAATVGIIISLNLQNQESLSTIHVASALARQASSVGTLVEIPAVAPSMSSVAVIPNRRFSVDMICFGLTVTEWTGRVGVLLWSFLL